MTNTDDTIASISPTPLELAQADLLLARIVDFARLLWELGLDVGPGSVVEVAESLPLINVGRMDEFYAFLKISLVTKHEQEAIFDQAFTYFWQSQRSGTRNQVPQEP